MVKPSLVIVGAGFTGLFTALHLRHQNHLYSIVLIDPQERFSFKPLLYELLSGELAEDTICPTYESLLEGSDISFVQDRVTDIDLSGKTVVTQSGASYGYQHLVLAVGSVQGYRHTDGAEDHAFPFRSWDEGKGLERHLRDCLKRARAAADPAERQALLTTAIVGGGPSGVEMAATLADLLPYWYEKLGGDGQELRILLLNHGKDILSGDSNAHLRPAALRAFRSRRISIELLPQVAVTSVRNDQLTYSQADGTDPSTLPACTTIWTAGTELHPLIRQLGSQIPSQHLDHHGNPLVNSRLQLLDFPEVFAAGDCATVQGDPQPALAQVAYQQGTAIARNLIALAKGSPPQPAAVSLRGTLMKMGLGEGLANLFDKMIIEATPGGLIRTATYLELLPTPLRDFKATVHWIDEEIFSRTIHELQHRTTANARPALPPADRRARRQVQALAMLAPLAFLLAVALALRTPPSEQNLSPPQTTGTVRSPGSSTNP
jgi:NADH dehydrogenase FAD-containing subunit